MSDTPPDRLCNNPKSPYYDAEAASKDGIQLTGIAPSDKGSRNVLKLSTEGWSAAIDYLKCGKL